MNTLITRAAGLISLAHFIWSGPGQAQSTRDLIGTVVLETEPVLFALDGYGAALGATLGPDGRWMVAAGLFGADLPDASRDLFFDGADDLDVRITWGAGLDVRYRLTGSTSGWFTGVGAGAEEFRARAPGGGIEEATSGFVTPHFGYFWNPGGGRLVIYPRAVGIFTISGHRTRTLEGIEYELQPLVPNLQLRVGLKF